MSRTLAVFLIVGVAGFACLGLFYAIGSEVDVDGVLREPFFLVPMGWVLSIIGFAGATVTVARTLIGR